VRPHAARWRAGQFSGINGIGIHGAEIEFMASKAAVQSARGKSGVRGHEAEGMGQSAFNAPLNASKLFAISQGLASATRNSAVFRVRRVGKTLAG